MPTTPTNFNSTQDTVNTSVNTVADALVSLKKSGLNNMLTRIIAMLIIGFNQASITKVAEFFNYQETPSWLTITWLQYNIAWGGIIFFIFVWAVWRRVKEMTITVNPPAPQNPAIKGLLAFNENDSEIFKNLERNNDIQTIQSALLDAHYRIGILIGDSGTGKTSFLKAGLNPALKEKGYQGVVVTFANQTPLASIKEALQEQLSITKLEDSDNLNQLLIPIIANLDKRSLILIFDQFEQFFTQNPILEQRKPFVNQLIELSKNNQIKLLISIRTDFVGSLYDIISALNNLDITFSPSKNYFKLNKFSVEQVIAIILHIAKIQNSAQGFVDNIFLKETLKDPKEGLTGNDGTISPTDLQIMLLVMRDQKSLTFDAKSFKELGGISGLLQRFLEGYISTKNIFNLNNEVLSTLLALIDLKTNTRVGQLSLEELTKKLNNIFDTFHLPNILKWLEENRLIHKIQVSDTVNHTVIVRYELAHERLIEPIRNIENTSTLESRRLAALLEQRVSEWQSNSRNNHYLLGLKEFYFINKYKKVLDFGDKKGIKQEYIAKSLKKLALQIGIFASLITLLTFVYFTYNSLWYKINFRVQDEIVGCINTTGSIIEENDVSSIIDTLTKVDDTKAKYVLNHLKISNDDVADAKADYELALIIKYPEKYYQHVNQIIKDTVVYSYDQKFKALSEIAVSILKTNPQKNHQQIISIVNYLNKADEFVEEELLSKVAISLMKANSERYYQQAVALASKSLGPKLLCQIAESLVKVKREDLADNVYQQAINKVINKANEYIHNGVINVPYMKKYPNELAYDNTIIAESLVKVHKDKWANEVYQQAINDKNKFKNKVLLIIAESLVKVHKEPWAYEIYKQLIDYVKDKKNKTYKGRLISYIVESMGNANPEKYYKQAKDITNFIEQSKIDSHYSKEKIMIKFFEKLVKVNPEKYYKEALKMANSDNFSVDKKTETLIQIAESLIKVKKEALAFSVYQKAINIKIEKEFEGRINWVGSEVNFGNFEIQHVAKSLANLNPEKSKHLFAQLLEIVDKNVSDKNEVAKLKAEIYYYQKEYLKAFNILTESDDKSLDKAIILTGILAAYQKGEREDGHD